MAKRGAGGTPATVALTRAGVAFRLHPYEHDPRAASYGLEAAERATGYVAGGISPLGQKRAHPTALDESALAHPTVLVSAGRRGLDLEIAPADLLRVTDAVRAPIAR